MKFIRLLLKKVRSLDFTIAQNVVIKKPVPKKGVACSNPERAQRILKQLTKIASHTESWGIQVSIGTYANKTGTQELFVASVPMGTAGSGFAFLELFAAGADHVIRFGSNDYPVDATELHNLRVITEVDNVWGLMRDSGAPQDTWGKPIPASKSLLDAVKQTTQRTKEFSMSYLPGHNIEDYHAFNNPGHLPPTERERVLAIKRSFSMGKLGAWDMETGALYWRAKQFGKNGLTVLQSIIKQRTKNGLRKEEYSKTILDVEQSIARLIFDTLLTV